MNELRKHDDGLLREKLSYVISSIIVMNKWTLYGENYVKTSKLWKFSRTRSRKQEPVIYVRNSRQTFIMVIQTITLLISRIYCLCCYPD